MNKVIETNLNKLSLIYNIIYVKLNISIKINGRTLRIQLLRTVEPTVA